MTAVTPAADDSRPPPDYIRIQCSSTDGLKNMRPWFLAVAAAFGLAAAANALAGTLPPATYTPLPAGTRLLYDNFECKVSSSSGYDTICNLADGGTLRLFGGFLDRGTIPASGATARLARVRSVSVTSLEYDVPAQAALKSLWPLQVGNSVEYEFDLKYRIPSCALAPTQRASTVQAKTKVTGIEPVQVNGVSYDSFVIREKTESFSVSECYSASRLDFERTWWYAPALGAVVKSTVVWTRGDARDTPAQSLLLRADFPPGSAPLVAAAPAPATTSKTAQAPAATTSKKTQTANAASTSTQKPSTSATQATTQPSTAPAASTTTAAASPPPPPIDAIDATYVAAKPANVRALPDVGSKRVATLRAGEKITVLGKVKDRDWYQVGRNDKPLGYVSTNQLLTEEAYNQAQTPPAPAQTAAAAPPPSPPAAASTTQAASAAPPPPPAAPATTQTAAAPASAAPAQPAAPAVAPAPAPAQTGAATPPTGALPPDIAKLNFGLYHALVIGNDNYRMLPSLHTAVGDARAVADTLRNVYGFDVTLLVDATRADILGALTKLRKSLGDSDNLVIYYAGHGAYDQQGDQGYWLPVDAAQDDPTNWVSNADLSSSLRAMLAKHVLVVADSCYSGTLTRGLSLAVRDPGYLERMVDQRSRTVLTSGGLEPVTDAGTGGHSVFARALLVALADNSATMDGQELFSRVREPVEANADQTPAYSIIRLAGHDGGDFVFVRK